MWNVLQKESHDKITTQSAEIAELKQKLHLWENDSTAGKEIARLKADLVTYGDNLHACNTKLEAQSAEIERLKTGIRGVFIYYEISKAFDYLRRLLKEKRNE
jgi:hypothetical protein